MKKLNCILLIDDNEHDNFFHSVAIKKADAANHIITALNGTEALAYLESANRDPVNNAKPDLIFLDINMPGINGFEFLEKARAQKLINQGQPSIIIMLTSSLNPKDEQLAREKFSVEIKGYLNKPLTAEVLKEMIGKFFK